MSSASEEVDIERSIPQDEPANDVEAEVESDSSALVVFNGSNDRWIRETGLDVRNGQSLG